MKSRTKKLIILVLVCALLCVAYFIIAKYTKSVDEDSIDSETITLCKIDTDTITGIHYVAGENDISFTSDNGQWVYDGDNDFPVTQNTLDEMAESLEEVTAGRRIDDPESLDSYGLSDPAVDIMITVGEDKYEICIGDYTSYASAYYVLYEDNIYLSSSSFTTLFDKSLFDYLTTTDKENIDSSAIVGITIDGKEYTDEETLSSLSGVYSSMTIGAVEDYKDKEKYGFDGTEHTVTISYTEDTDVTDSDGNTTSTITNTLEYKFSFAYVGDNAYIMLPCDDLIYNVTGVDDFVLAN